MKIRKAWRAAPTWLALLASLTATQAEADDELRNWFNDPFFQISAGIADCPVPAGPFVTEAERRVQAHRRAEKGTTCWLAGECERPNAYVYDADIAAALQAGLRDQPRFADTTLWVTVQGRVVYVEGCVTEASAASELEAFARALPHVQQASVMVRVDAAGPVPYKVRSKH
nr:BON domain-containing protein [uncultured Roseateles sp.]